MREAWKPSTLGECCSVVVGGTPRTSEASYWADDIPWVTPTDITAAMGRTITATARSISQKGLAKSSATLVKAGSTLVTTRATIGPCVMAGGDLATNQGVTALTPMAGLDPSWLFYWVCANQRTFQALGAGNTFPEVARSKTRSIAIAIPPLPEQRRIADLMAVVDAVIEASDTAIAAAERWRTALLSELLDPQTDDPDSVREGWEPSTLGECCSVVVGGTPRTSEASYWADDIPWVTPTDITAAMGRTITATARSISQKGLAKSSATLVKAGSTLVTTRATIGPCVIAGGELATNQGVTALTPTENLDSRWLFYWVCANERTFQALGAGNTFPEVARSKTRSIAIAIPPLPEQRRIADLMGAVDNEREALVAQRDATRRLRTALLDRLLSGEHEIPESYDRFVEDAADEPGASEREAA